MMTKRDFSFYEAAVFVRGIIQGVSILISCKEFTTLHECLSVMYSVWCMVSKGRGRIAVFIYAINILFKHQNILLAKEDF